MLFNDSAANYLKRSRVVVWALIVIVLVLNFVFMLESVEQNIDETAYLLASKRIIDRASFYKQKWLINEQQHTLTVEGKKIRFSASGWPLPVMSGNKTDCEYWLSLLYPEKRILDSLPASIEENTGFGDYRCVYTYDSNKSIHIQLVDHRFSVSIGFALD
ncbi:MSHA biogenesis protein MshF [Vibrio ostreicida]|uniref:MSHA biogenesis protein MshF n=1 Tax=Vibrio ostreicida TaxID=526588 RepID=UPI003B5B9FFA